MSRMFIPLSITCVRPSVRGLPGLCGRLRNPSLKAGIELLQLLLGSFLNVVEERVAVTVDADGEWPEILDAELPQALGHEFLTVDLFDLLDLCRLERGRAADDREIDHPVLAHRLDRLVRQAALAADRAHAVVAAERLGEAHHARGRGGADADLLVLEVRSRRVVVLDVSVADADDVAVDEHLVARAQLADRGFGRGKAEALRTHGRTSPPRRRRCAPS